MKGQKMDFKKYQSQWKIFLSSEAGEHFVKKLEVMIELHHEAAETNPELSYRMMKASGIREVLNHINSVKSSTKRVGGEK